MFESYDVSTQVQRIWVCTVQGTQEKYMTIFKYECSNDFQQFVLSFCSSTNPSSLQCRLICKREKQYVKLNEYFMWTIHFCLKFFLLANLSSSVSFGLLVPSGMLSLLASNTVLFKAFSSCLRWVRVHLSLELLSTWHQDSMFMFFLSSYCHGYCFTLRSQCGSTSKPYM